MLDASRRRDRQRLTVPEAATVLGVTVDAVRGRIRRGKLEAEHEGSTVYVFVGTKEADGGVEETAAWRRRRPKAA